LPLRHGDPDWSIPGGTSQSPPSTGVPKFLFPRLEMHTHSCVIYLTSRRAIGFIAELEDLSSPRAALNALYYRPQSTTMTNGREAAARRFTALRLRYLAAQPLPPPWHCNHKPVRSRSFLPPARSAMFPKLSSASSPRAPQQILSRGFANEYNWEGLLAETYLSQSSPR
jgi:hypothetical protein